MVVYLAFFDKFGLYTEKVKILEDVAGEMRYSKATVEKIISIQRNILCAKERNVRFKVTSEYISPGMYPLFWSLPYVGNLCNKIVEISHDIGNERLHQALVKHGVSEHYVGEHDAESTVKKIPFQLIKQNSNDTESNTDKIVEKICMILPVQMAQDYEFMFISKLYEVFDNSIKHGKNNIGLFANGYFDKNQNKFTFTIYDFGRGIPNNVKSFLNNNTMTDKEAFEWALTDGNTTAMEDCTRGAGLGVLEKFIQINNGKIIFCSGNCFCEISGNGRKFRELREPIIGTLFSMRVNADRKKIYII